MRVVRIFNTYGPRMALDDGRVVSNFVAQALTGQPMTIYGDGQQTRSFQYVSDLVQGAPIGTCCMAGRTGSSDVSVMCLFAASRLPGLSTEFALHCMSSAWPGHHFAMPLDWDALALRKSGGRQAW